ncbi:hypothetical protein D3C72_2263340 [compost metagenome]
MYAARQTTPVESRLVNEPVISVIRIIPVIGAVKLAVSNPAMAKIRKLLSVSTGAPKRPFISLL